MFPSSPDPSHGLLSLFRRVDVVRAAETTLFTFGDSELDYFLVCEADEPGEPVLVVRGQVKVTRPTLLRPDSRPELSGFFEELDEQYGGVEGTVQFMMSRTAAFEHLDFDNVVNSRETYSDSVEEVVDRLGRKLDAEGDNGTAILTAPAGLGPIAVIRYTTEQISRSTPGNIRELQEKGFLS